MNNYLFVYGTLMKKYTGYAPINLEDFGKYICEGFINGRMYEIDNYPGVIRSQNPQDKIYGELFLLSDFEASIQKLDVYEDYFPENLGESLYLRKIEDIYLSDGEIKPAWIYLFNKEVNVEKRILSGNYLDFSC